MSFYSRFTRDFDFHTITKLEAAGNIWIFSKRVFHTVWKTLLKTQIFSDTLYFYMLENLVVFQPSPDSTQNQFSVFALFQCKKTGKNLCVSHRFFHKTSTWGNFPRKNPQTFLFHKESFQGFPQALTHRKVLHKRRNFSPIFQKRFPTPRKT